MLKATFNGMKFDNIEGYRISCRLNPGRGFQGDFYVYIEERRQAQTAFELDVKVSEMSEHQVKPIRGTLEISDEDMNYQFKNIDLRHAEMGATRRERTRYFEFTYDTQEIGKDGADPITINGLRSKPLGPAGLGQDYMGGLGANRHLLGFRAYVGSGSSTIVRLANLGCMTDSFLAKAVELNKELVSGNKIMPPFNVKFSQRDLEITKENLLAMYVEESRGSMLRLPIYPVSRIIEETARAASIERLQYPELSGNDLLAHDSFKEFKSYEVLPGTVETTTVVFKEGGDFADFSVR